MSTITTDQSAPPSSDSAPATPTGSGGGASKRNLFGRKKKSAANLGTSPSTNTLGSAGSSLKSGQSIESLQDKTGTNSETAGGKIKSVFKRKGGKSDSGGGTSIGSIEEDREREAVARDGVDEDDAESGERKERASEDDSVLSYDSETDVTPPRPSTAGASLTVSSTMPKTQSAEPIPGKPMHAATFAPYSSTTTTTITGGNTKSETSPPKKGAVVDILKAPFRRSTSPNPPVEPDTPATKNTNGMSNVLPWANTSLPTTSTTPPPDTRPATSGGESRRSEDRGRRTGRISVGTSDASELTLGKDSAPTKKWPGGIITKDYAQPAALQDPSNPDGTVVQTTVTPPTPTDASVHFAPKSPVGSVVNATGARRNRTNSLTGTPSKLSQSMTAPLTPTNEGSGGSGGSTQGGGSPGSSNGGGGAGGFFQSMFSAAQTAATSISNTIANTNLANNGPGGRPRTGTGQSDKEGEKENIPQGGTSEGAEPQRRLAVETLGHGELSLGSLGILPSPKKTGFGDGGSSVSRSGSIGSNMGRSDDTLVGGRYAEKGSNDDGDVHGGINNTPISAISNADTFETATNSPINGSDTHRIIRTPVAEDNAFIGGHRDSPSGNMTPERSSALATNEIDDTWFGDGDRRRSGSVKSVRRKRGSSAASGAGIMQPVPKPTGFAVASKKRNRDFHALFRSVPEDDYLIEDYGCALQKEILLQGRFYVSEGHICFNSNIFGWINTLVISFDEVVSVEKKSTAMVFPNAIVIQTLHARHVFASFISRDSTYDLIVGIWKIGHPQLVHNTTGVRLEEGAAAGVEDRSIVDGGSEYEEEEEEDEYEDGSDDELGESYTDAGDGFLDGAAEGGVSKSVSRKASQQPVAAGDLVDGAVGVDFPGPATHSPTQCTDASDHTHYDKPLCDEIIPAPLGRVYSLAFGPASYPFISRFLAEEEKVLDIQIPEKGEWRDADGKKVRSFSYIKPLGGPIGPKQTKCNITETIEWCDLEDHVSVVVATQTPDVPSGNVFVVKSKYCLMWAPEGATRMIATCTVEWNGKSWLKGPIEKGASDGQIAYNSDLVAALKRECVPKEPANKSAKKMSKKKRKALEAKGEAIGRSVAGTVKGREANAAGFASPAQMESWGIFAPLKTYLGPVIDVLQPLLNGNLGILVICVLLTVLVMGRRGGSATTDVGRGGAVGARYWEQTWQAEEEGLWEWLEDRSGLGGIGDLGRERRLNSFEKVLGRRGRVGKGMKQREVEEAIGVMEERLEVLKKIVEARKGKKEES